MSDDLRVVQRVARMGDTVENLSGMRGTVIATDGWMVQVRWSDGVKGWVERLTGGRPSKNLRVLAPHARVAGDVWTLTVDGHQSLETTVHESERAALAFLADKHDPDGEWKKLGGGDVVAGMTEYGFVIYIESHHVVVAGEMV